MCCIVTEDWCVRFRYEREVKDYWVEVCGWA